MRDVTRDVIEAAIRVN